jgi:hypothetical protein
MTLPANGILVNGQSQQKIDGMLVERREEEDEEDGQNKDGKIVE